MGSGRALIVVNRTKTRVSVVYTISMWDMVSGRDLIVVNRTKTRVSVVYWSGHYTLLTEKT